MRLSDDVIHVSFRREDFRIAFGPPFLLVFAATLALSEALFIYLGNDARHILFLVLPVLVTVLCVVAISLMTIRSAFQLSRDGIACYDLWSRPHATSWDVVQDVQRVQSVGFSYLKITLRDKKQVIWLPLFVSRASRLEELLTHYLEATIPTLELSRIWQR